MQRPVRGGKEGSGLPAQKVAEQGQALVRALFGVKLGGENIIACDGAGKAPAVVGLCSAMLGLLHHGVETVHEVVEAVFGNSTPQRVGLPGIVLAVPPAVALESPRPR